MAITTIRPTPKPGVLAAGASPMVERAFFAIAHLDMVGYSRLIGLDDLGTIDRLRKLRRALIDPAIQEYGGRLVQTAGNSLLVIFDSLTEAVRCMIEIQQTVPVLDEEPLPERRMRFRVGIELGEVISDGGGVHGESVAIAVRLQSACPPGCICVSGAVHEHIRTVIKTGFERIGPLTLKNIAQLVDAFVARIDCEGAARQGAELAADPPVHDHLRASVRILPNPSGGRPRLAVLPFEQFDNQTIPRHVSDGLVADIICQLAGLRELSVISHGSTIALRGAAADPLRIGRQLGARYLVRGSLRRAGLRTRLTTELTEADSGSIIWARTIDLDGMLSFDGQDRVVGQVVNTLAPRVREIELQRIRGKRPDSLSVYEKVLLARENVLLLRNETFALAKSLLDEAVAEEPDYADAYALAADWHGLRLGQGWSSDRRSDVAAVDRLAQQALLLDGDNVRALVCYGHRKSLLHRDYPAALEMFRRALDAAPSSAHAWLKSSYTFAYIGEAEEAIRRAERALEFSPCDREPHLFYSALCVAHYTAGNFDTAAQWGMQALGEPTMLRATVGWTAASLAALGRITEAHDLAARAVGHWPHRDVQDAVARHPYQNPAWRQRYGELLLAAGFPS